MVTGEQRSHNIDVYEDDPEPLDIGCAIRLTRPDRAGGDRGAP